MSSSFRKEPPKLTDDTVFEDWLEEIVKWQAYTDAAKEKLFISH